MAKHRVLAISEDAKAHTERQIITPDAADWDDYLAGIEQERYVSPRLRMEAWAKFRTVRATAQEAIDCSQGAQFVELLADGSFKKADTMAHGAVVESLIPGEVGVVMLPNVKLPAVNLTMGKLYGLEPATQAVVEWDETSETMLPLGLAVSANELYFVAGWLRSVKTLKTTTVINNYYSCENCPGGNSPIVSGLWCDADFGNATTYYTPIVSGLWCDANFGNNATQFIPIVSGLVADADFGGTQATLAAPVLSAAGVNANTIRMSWTHPGGATDFELQHTGALPTWYAVDGGVFGGTYRTWDTTPWPTGVLYYFRMRARLANGTVSEWSNVVSAKADATLPDFVFITNTTGYFDTDNFNAKITNLAPSARIVRWCVRWDEYETSPGTFRTEKLAARLAQIDAIYAAQGLSAPMYAVDFWGVRHDDKIEQFIPANDVVVFQNGKRATGDVVFGKCYGLGSFSSSAYRNRMAAAATSITSWFAQNAPGRLYYTCFSTGQTEEFYNYLWDNPDSPYNFESHGDFSPTALNAFRFYCVGRFGTTTPWGEASTSATLPTANWDTDHQAWTVSNMMQTAKGKVWAEFTNREMQATVMAFGDASKSANANVAVIHFIADFYRLQANGWLACSPSVFPIVEKLDGLYHSDGDTMDDDDYAKKYSSFDCMVPTWGANKLYFCELDYKDMYMVDSGLPSKEAIKRTARAVYRKGGKGIHYAMSMTAAQAAEANAANLEILAEIAAGTLTRLDRSNAPNYTFNLSPMVFGGNNQLLDAYKNTFGGTETNVVNIQLINNTSLTNS